MIEARVVEIAIEVVDESSDHEGELRRAHPELFGPARALGLDAVVVVAVVAAAFEASGTGEAIPLVRTFGAWSADELDRILRAQTRDGFSPRLVALEPALCGKLTEIVRAPEHAARASSIFALLAVVIDAYHVELEERRRNRRVEIWRGLEAADVQFIAGDVDGCYDRLRALFDRFKSEGDLIGNPLFHLRAGQCQFLQRGPKIAEENLVRALTGGGIAMFDGEDPRFLEFLVSLLVPPAGYPTWEASRVGYAGITRDMLEDAPERLFRRFAERGLVPAKRPA